MKINEQFKPNTTVLLIDTVSDSISGKGISGASIKLTYATGGNSSKHLKRIAVARTNGKFVFEDVPLVQKYSLLVSAVGYKSMVREVLMPMSKNSRIRAKNIGTIRLLRQLKKPGDITVTTILRLRCSLVRQKNFVVERNINAYGRTV